MLVIGLRNAVLGDTFVRMLRASGRRVEAQNYVDNTGVQVADVVVGFHYLEKKTPADVRKLLEETNPAALGDDAILLPSPALPRPPTPASPPALLDHQHFHDRQF